MERTAMSLSLLCLASPSQRFVCDYSASIVTLSDV